MRVSSERGYAMAALLVALSVMAIMLSVALPTWRTAVQRERETELVFRGEQYVQAISLYSRRTGGFPTSLNALRDGRYIRKLYKDPITNQDFQPVLLGQVPVGSAPVVPGQPQGRGATPGMPGAGGQRFGGPPLTGAANQPARGAGAGQPATGMFGQTGLQSVGPIIGVASRSTAQSLRLYNGRNHYNEWLFVTTAATQQVGAPSGAPAAGRAGLPGRGGTGAQPLGPGRGGRGTGLDGPNRGGPSRGFPTPTMPQPFGPGPRGRF